MKKILHGGKWLTFVVVCLSIPAMASVNKAAELKGGAPFSGPSAPSFQFAPEFHFDEHLQEYFHPKDEDFKKRYFLENSTFVEAAFFSIKNRYFFFGNVVTNFGMGRQEGAILLDPRDVDMAFGPTFEYHADGRNIKAGLDHHCFHQIDVPEWNTLYWNKLFLSYGSSNFRQGDYWKQLGRPGNSGWRERLSWQAGYGYFMHSLGGVLDTNAVSWGHSYVHELSLSARWTFFHDFGWAVFADGESRARIDRRGAWLWTETMGCEAMTVRGSFGVSLFVHWIAVDQSIIRENRDKLVEVGARVFK
jgi:hypothetical protein